MSIIPPGQRRTPTWVQKISLQGPWNPETHPLSLDGPASLPMPVKISDADSLKPFFDYLQSNAEPVFDADQKLEEPYYKVEMREFEKGVMYVDGRMDLCKMVVGPTHISSLMSSLSTNTHIKHFLLGNNIIGPAGARAISEYCSQNPDRIETWYLAGNCIDSKGFHLLAEQFSKSTVLHSVWLKRNPLGKESIEDLYKLIVNVPTLRTLDLDMTSLGDIGVSSLFSLLSSHPTPVSLKNIYLNSNGVGSNGCSSISTFLSSPNCNLESLFLSLNPLGESGATALSKGLGENKSLIRLTLSSCGLTSPGGILILASLKSHPSIQVLDLGQSYATEDLNQRFNYFEDGIEESITQLLTSSQSIRVLNLGMTALTHPTIENIAQHVISSPSLFSYTLDSIHPAVNRPKRPSIKTSINNTLLSNIRSQPQYSTITTLEEFNAGPLRFLRNTEDVRFIDSVYRNRDAQKARRKEVILDKWWTEEDGLLKEVADS